MSRPKTIAVYALTAPGAETARRLAASLGDARVFLPQRLAGPGEEGFTRLAEALAAGWDAFGGHVVVAAAGVVVRAIAPLLAHKTVDPAVVVLDGAGRFAVSLLSGHLGGANDLAQRAAAVTGGEAVVTTASDAAGLPALEVLTAELGWRVENLGPLAAAARELVEGRALPLHDPEERLMPHLAPWPGRFQPRGDAPPAGDAGPGVWVGWGEPAPGGGWLALRPPCLALGMGMNRGAGADELEGLARALLTGAGLSPLSLACLASADIKRDEPGLLELARRLDLPLKFFDATMLKQVKVPHPSQVVERHLGTGSVCEAAAILAARGGRLLAGKQKSANATAAVALMPADGST